MPYASSVFIFILALLIITSFAWSNFVAYASPIDDLRQQIEEREREIEQLREQAKEFEQSVTETRQYSDTIQGQVNNFNREINALQSRISIKEQEVRKAQLTIQTIELEIGRREAEMVVKKTHVGGLLQEIYENDHEGILELLLRHDSLSGFYGQVQARESLQDAMVNAIETLRVIKDELANDIAKLEFEQEQFRYDKTVLAGQREVVVTEKVRQSDLLRQSREQESRYQDLLDEIRRQEQETQLEIFRLEEELRQTIDPSSIPEAREGLLAWPAEGILTQNYGCTKFAKNSGLYGTCFHNGIDIAAGVGAPVIATEDGVVVGLSNAPRAYGKWIAVKHGRIGLISLYGHLSKQNVSLGQEVSRGDLIGFMGSTGLSTGSHLHFTIFLESTYTTKQSKFSGIIPLGATLDPTPYLN